MFPNSKKFIFTIFDDTDVSTLGNIKPVYDFLSSLGILTTKSVWPLSCDINHSWYYGSNTLQDREYSEYIKDLANLGFEIGFHGATMESSTREKTEYALHYFNDILGCYPRIYACHSKNKENIYWGSQRFSFIIFSCLYKALHHDGSFYEGVKPNSPYFWGDLCLEHFDYVRTFTYDTVNLLEISSQLPYNNKEMGYVNRCFFTADADNVEEFNQKISISNMEKLEREGGVCILTTHFGKGFVENGKLNETTGKLLKNLSLRNGWFVPVSTALDFLGDSQGGKQISKYALFLLEFKWFVHAVKRKLTKKKYKKTEVKYLTNN